MLKTEVDNITTQVEALKQKLINFIEGLPDANCFKRLGPNYGTITFGDIQKHRGILSPSYYLSFDVKKYLIRTIKNKSITELNSFIDGLIAEQSYENKEHTEPIRPDIIQKIKELWYGTDIN
jgi:hypothetical protein